MIFQKRNSKESFLNMVKFPVYVLRNLNLIKIHRKILSMQKNCNSDLLILKNKELSQKYFDNSKMINLWKKLSILNVKIKSFFFLLKPKNKDSNFCKQKFKKYIAIISLINTIHFKDKCNKLKWLLCHNLRCLLW